MLYKYYFYTGIKRRSAEVNTEVNDLIQSTVNKEKTFKTRDISIKLVDIAKSYEKQKTNLTEVCIVIDKHSQFYMGKDSAKETTIINKNVKGYYEISKIIEYYKFSR